MKSIIFLFVLTFSFAAAAQKNKKPSELDKLKDTLTSKLAVIDTLNEKIEKLETELKKCKKKIIVVIIHQIPRMMKRLSA